jgi:hypothetical protein
MSDPVDLSQRRAVLAEVAERRAVLAEVAEDRLIAWRTHVDVMFQCSAILTDALKQMWAAGAGPSEIVETLHAAAAGIARRAADPITDDVET